MLGKPIIPPVHLTATYKFDKSDDLIDVVQNRSGYLYSRWDNPSVMEVENAMAALEGFDKALGFGSGMAAITTAIMANIGVGSRIIATREIYGATFELLDNVLPKLNVETVLINCWDTRKIKKEIENHTVAVRKVDGTDLGSMDREKFANLLINEVQSKS